MMRAHLPVVGFIGVLLAASLGLAEDTTPYPIKLDRASKIGDVYQVHHTVEAHGTSTRTVGTRPPETYPNRPLQGELSGRCEVTEVDGKGNETGLSITVQKFIVDTKEAFPSGTILAIKCSRAPVTYKVEGKEVSGQPASVLHLLYPPIREATIGDDDCFGSKAPRKVGESWPVNAESIAQHSSFGDVEVDPKKVTGEATLKGVESVRDTQVLRLVTKYSMTDFLKPTDLPATISIGASKTTFELTRLLPVDGVSRPLAVELKVDSKQTHSDKSHADTVIMSYQSSIRIQYSITTVDRAK